MTPTAERVRPRLLRGLTLVFFTALACGADWLERAERTREERPDLVLAALPLEPGIAVADSGAGTGYYARRMAERSGASGIVYATDCLGSTS
ncbi:MAG TPA: hypothetical protein VHP37_11080 [Burkholderiales bacterium]|nr:hypothetical protein [Burkholderiales bacterium]